MCKYKINEIIKCKKRIIYNMLREEDESKIHNHITNIYCDDNIQCKHLRMKVTYFFY